MKTRSKSSLPEYTYHKSTKKEDIKLLRRIAVIMAAFGVVLVVIWFATTTFLSALANLSAGNTDDTPTPKNNTLPLLVPEIDKLPKATNKREINVSGETTSQVTVTLFLNGKEIEEVEATTTGDFTFEDVTLKTGLNAIKVVASNETGKESTTETITLDRTKPVLTLSKPKDGDTLAANAKTVTVSGSTEKTAIVYVNGSQAVVDSNGSFSFTAAVKKGENSLKIKAVDEAGNTTETEISVTVGEE